MVPNRAAHHRYPSFHIISTLKVLTFWFVLANDVECIFEYILNRKSFGRETGKIFNKNFTSFGGLGPKSRFYLFHKVIVINEK